MKSNNVGAASKTCNTSMLTNCFTIYLKQAPTIFVRKMESGLYWLGSQFLLIKIRITSMGKSLRLLKALSASIGLPMVATIILDMIMRLV